MGANTVVFTSADGYQQAFPVDFLIEKGAIIASHVNGEEIQDVVGSANQLWIPGVPAKYFVRDIVRVDFEHREQVPALAPFVDDGHDYVNRPNVGMNAPYLVVAGTPATFTGWAYDFDKRIVAMEYSMDSGATWSAYPVEGADSTRWVQWSFAWTPPRAGDYSLQVRSVNEDGKKSPTSAVSRLSAY